MNFQQYFCNIERIYLMHEILELYDVSYYNPGDYMHFNLKPSKDKYFGINLFTNSPNDVKVSFNWEYIIEKIIYHPKEYIATYQVNLV
jgi:hypothetical protein